MTATYYCVLCGQFTPTRGHECDRSAEMPPPFTDDEEEQETFVYLVTMTAVYDHGTAGVFTTREAAEAHTQALADDSDGHHDFRIEEIALDARIDVGPRSYVGRKRTPEIEFISWDRHDTW